MDSYSDFNAKNLSSSTNMSISLPGQVGLNTTGGTPSMSISRLFPALLECFGIILCGYIAGRANIITSTQAKGLGNFVSRFALPALLFKNMVVLKFSNVNWSFLYSILVAKAAVFFLVCILTLLVASPENRFSKAGLFPIFATQSNDFALGYPIGKYGFFYRIGFQCSQCGCFWFSIILNWLLNWSYYLLKPFLKSHFLTSGHVHFHKRRKLSAGKNETESETIQAPLSI